DIDVDRYPLLHREVDRRGRCAVVDGGEPAGVAMSEDVDRLSGRLFLGDLANNGEPVPADGAVDGDVFGGDLGRLRIAQGGARRRLERAEAVAHGVERPAQVDRRRPGGVEPLPGRLEAPVARII